MFWSSKIVQFSSAKLCIQSANLGLALLWELNASSEFISNRISDSCDKFSPALSKHYYLEFHTSVSRQNDLSKNNPRKDLLTGQTTNRNRTLFENPKFWTPIYISSLSLRGAHKDGAADRYIASVVNHAAGTGCSEYRK